MRILSDLDVDPAAVARWTSASTVASLATAALTGAPSRGVLRTTSGSWRRPASSTAAVKAAFPSGVGT